MEGEETWDAVAQAAREALVAHGPLPLDELAAALEAKGLELGADPFELLEGVLSEGCWALPLPDGRVVDVDALLDGLTLTHRLSEREADDGLVAVEPDFSPLLARDTETLPLAGGGTAWLSFPGGHDPMVDDGHPLADQCVLIGSAGWLGGAAGGDLLAFRLDGGCLSVGPAEEDLADPTEAVQQLASAFDEASEDGGPVESWNLIVVALAGAPDLLRRPLPPLSQLYTDAGLETSGPWVGLEGQDWVELDKRLEEAFVGLSQQMWDLDEMEAEALGILLGAYALVANGQAETLTADPQIGTILGQMLLLPDVAEAFVGSVLDHGSGNEPAVTAFAQVLVDAGGGSAGTHYVLSRCAEARGDATAGEAQLAAALAVDPGFEPALLDAAWYAEDRGDAARALGYLRVAGIDADGDEAQMLQRFAAPGPAKAGRNDPCTCGSGRKYKVCCSRRNGHPLLERAGWLHSKACAFLLRPAQRAALVELALARTGGDSALHDSLTQDLALFDTDTFASFLDVRGELLPADELELGRSWVGRSRSLYEVTDVWPGEGMRLYDLRTGERLDVTERLRTHDLAVGDLLYARAVPDGRSHLLLGGTVAVPQALRGRLMAFLDAKPGPGEVAAWFGDEKTWP